MREIAIEFETPHSITLEHNGSEEIYVPREFGAVFSKNTKYDRHMQTFKKPRGATNFLLRHGAVLKNQGDKS